MLATALLTSSLLLAPPLPVTLEANRDEEISYVSDFLVFAGADADGRVLFAFDANRGNEGEKYQAEHFQRLWVEGEGWSTLPGEEELAVEDMWELPSSKEWQISGDTAEGFQLACASREFELRTEPLADRTWRELEGDIFSTAAGSATLTIGERELRGHVHHEFCFLVDRNPLVKTYTDLFGDGFHGVYAIVGEGENVRPFKYHRTGGTLRGLLKRSDGYTPEESASGWSRIPANDFDASDWDLAGFFSWPGRYAASWAVGEDESALQRSFRLSLRQREVVANYVIAGLAVNVVEGTINLTGKPEPVFGMALIVR